MVLVIAVLSDAGFGQGNNGPQPLDVTNVACVERMEVPRYPALAAQARIEGTIKAAVLLTTAGAVEKVDTETTSKYSQAKSLFGAPVWKAIREAKFHSDCAGKTVTFVFHFSLQGTSPVQTKSAVFFGYPNTFWIVAEAMLVQPDGQVNASPAIDNRVSGRVLDPLGDPIRNQPVQLKATESSTTVAVTRTGAALSVPCPPTRNRQAITSSGTGSRLAKAGNGARVLLPDDTGMHERRIGAVQFQPPVPGAPDNVSQRTAAGLPLQLHLRPRNCRQQT
jgi:hypothetical protein